MRERDALLAAVRPLALGTLLIGLVACGGPEPVPEPVLRPVRYQKVYTSGGARERSFAGTSQAALESRLSFKVGGTVSRVGVKVGESVAPGDLIAELDATDYALQVKEAEAALASARAQARNAQAAYSRARALYENRNASKNDLDVARAADESARAQREASERRLELARLQVSYTRLLSPSAGAIASVSVDPNENVGPGQPVALLTSSGRLEVEVAIPEVLIAQIREGDSVRVAFDAIPERRFAGRVTEVGVSSTGFATTFPVTVQVADADPQCRPGMAAEVIFRSGSSGDRDRVRVPSSAAGEDRDGRFVYVVEPSEPGEGIVHRRTVTVGALTEAGLEILDGISDGALVVTAGVSRIHDGQRVRLLAQP